MFDGRFRATVDKGVRPLGAGLRRTGITADHLTGAGLVLAGACAVAVGSGHLLIGMFLLVAAAVPDLLDGAVAKASGMASPRGAYFDSVSDRVTDSLVLGAIAWHLAGTRGGHLAILPLAVLGSSTLISYQRAKAESLGYQAKGGLMERAERIIALSVALAFPVLLVPILWIMLALTVFTNVQRFVKVWKQASVVRPTPLDLPARQPAASRWRAWRASVQVRPSRGARASRRGAGTATTRWQARRADRVGAARSRPGSGAWLRRSGPRD